MAPRLTTLSLSGITLFTSLVGLEHILRPDYDPRRRFISEYAVGPYKGVMTTAFFTLAAGSAALLAGLARTVPPHARSAGGLLCLGIWSGGILVAGIFPTDLSEPLVEQTRQGMLHEEASLTALAILPQAGLLMGWRFRHDPRWSPVARPSVALGVAEFGALLVAVRSPSSRQGLAQRLLIALDLTWLTWMSLALRARTAPQEIFR